MAPCWHRAWKELFRKQTLWIGIGYVVVGILGTAAIRPVGPGSARILYWTLLAYSLVLVVLCSKLTRVLALLLAIAFLVAAIIETKARQHSQQKLKESLESGLRRVENMNALHGALLRYCSDHGALPPADTTDRTGRRMHSWRVLLLPYLGEQALYSKINLNEPWDSPANRRLSGRMPEYYRSPLEAETHGTTTNYFAVLGPHATWWNGGRVKPWEAGGAAILIELVGSKTPWMEPWDPTLDELLDMLRPEGGDSPDGNRATDVMYLTVSGDVRTVDPRTDRESMRKLLLGRGK
jgi:hypothetical protein